MRVLRQYKYFLTEMFGLQCGHLSELALIYLSLRSLQFRLADSMGQDEWAHLFWAIVVDSRQFFGTLTDAEDLTTGILPMSNLATTRSIIQAHTVLSIRDTLSRWLPIPRAPATPPSRAAELGASPGGKRKTGERDGNVGGGANGGRGAGGQDVRLVTFAKDLEQPDVANTSRHPLISTLMEPLERAGVDWSINKLCKAAKIKGGVRDLPAFPNRRACFRFILGKCKAKCPTNCDHLDRRELPENTVKALCSRLAPGVAAVCKNAGVGLPPALKKPRRE